MVLGCVACSRPLVQCQAKNKINWALANRDGDPLETISPEGKFFWQENEGEVYLSSCGHLYHKKCLFELFSDILNATAAAASGGNVNNFGTSSVINPLQFGVCVYCGAQMIPTNCFRIYMKPTGNPMNTTTLLYIKSNNKLRDHIVNLNEAIRSREKLLEAIQSDRLYIKKLRGKQGKKSHKSSNEDVTEEPSRNNKGDGKANERQEIISELNSKLVTLLEESICAKETMSDLYGSLKLNAPWLATQFGIPGKSKGANNEIRNRTVYLDDLGGLRSKDFRNRLDSEGEDYHPCVTINESVSRHKSQQQLHQRKTNYRQESWEGLRRGGFRPVVPSSITHAVPRESMSYLINSDFDEDDDFSFSDYPVTPDFSTVLETFNETIPPPEFFTDEFPPDDYEDIPETDYNANKYQKDYPKQGHMKYEGSYNPNAYDRKEEVGQNSKRKLSRK